MIVRQRVIICFFELIRKHQRFIEKNIQQGGRSFGFKSTIESEVLETIISSLETLDFGTIHHSRLPKLRK